MNINKFTQKSLQAVQNCERIAMDYGNQEIAQEHLLYALLTQDDSLIAKLMEKMGQMDFLQLPRLPKRTLEPSLQSPTKTARPQRTSKTVQAVIPRFGAIIHPDWTAVHLQCIAPQSWLQ